MGLYQWIAQWFTIHLRNLVLQVKIRLSKNRELKNWCKLVSNVPKGSGLLTPSTWRMSSKDPLRKLGNGLVYNPIPPVVSEIEDKAKYLKQGLQLLRGILPSAIPYLLFLIIYGLNEKLGICLRFQDVDKPGFYVYNVSAIEYRILHFSPHKLISSVHFLPLDFLSAVPYLIHYVIPILYPTFLVIKGQTNDIKRFYWLLGWVLWCQYIIWYFFPTAPQWYYDNMDLYSTQPAPSLIQQHKDGCAFHRVDSFTHGNFFYKLFNGNPIPFGAFPSGHVMWPFTIFVINPPFGRWFLVYVLWVIWATLYSCHHYLSDAVGAIVLVLLVRKVVVIIQNKLGNIKEDSACKKISCLQVLSTNACPYGIV